MNKKYFVRSELGLEDNSRVATVCLENAVNGQFIHVSAIQQYGGGLWVTVDAEPKSLISSVESRDVERAGLWDLLEARAAGVPESALKSVKVQRAFKFEWAGSVPEAARKYRRVIEYCVKRVQGVRLVDPEITGGRLEVALPGTGVRKRAPKVRRARHPHVVLEFDTAEQAMAALERLAA